VSRTDGADLWVINLLGEATPRLLIGDAAESAISPDGRLIAFMRGEPLTLWVSGINGEAPRKLGEDLAFQALTLESNVWMLEGF
jgi:Tol biopolymer transport system component